MRAGYSATLQALEAGMLGMAFTNGSPYVAPTRSATSLFSTLPISLAAPGIDGDHMLLDMATAAAAVGKYIVFMDK